MKNKTGLLLIGALGHLATTVMLGVIALKNGLCDKTGMVTELDELSELDLQEPETFVFGGWDIRAGSVFENARSLFSEMYHLPMEKIPGLEKEFNDITKNIWNGTAKNNGDAVIKLATGTTARGQETIHDTISRLKSNINKFKDDNDLDAVVVINLTSTEPPLPQDTALIDLTTLNKIIDENDEAAVRPSTIYAYASIDSGCIYINFTPSNGALIPGVIELAIERGVPVMGCDGKTGETLVKSALAPMFACRNLKVLSWEGYNILGNMDGKILSHPDNKTSKIKSKDRVLSKVLGYQPHSKVSIDYVPSLGDQKTAWDFIHFKGFLNTKMSLQFTWQGCDSALAAPLVLDLARLGVFAYLNGEKGLMKHLACFFKSPIGVDEHNLHEQFRMLKDYVKQYSNRQNNDSYLQNVI